MGKSPAFQIYPKDFISDFDVQNMNMEEVGVYIYLLFADWLEDGIPDDITVVKGWLKHRCTTLDSVVTPFSKFTILKNSKRYNPRLDKERQKQEIWRQKSSEGGKKAAAARRETKGGSSLVENGTRVEPPEKCSSSSVSSLQSSSSLTPLEKEKTILEVAKYTELARHFLEQQREQFPNESALVGSFETCVIDGAKKLRLFHTKEKWSYDEIDELLCWILDDEFWCKQIRTLGGIRIRKQGKGNPMKFENARASMEHSPKEKSVMKMLEEIEDEPKTID